MLSFISPDLTSPAAAQFYPAKSVRAGYSPGCCKRLQLQPLPQNPFTKLIFCFDTLEEAHQWTEAFQWCQQAREILDEADAAAAAGLPKGLGPLGTKKEPKDPPGALEGAAAAGALRPGVVRETRGACRGKAEGGWRR